MCTYFLPERLPNGLDVASSGRLQRRAFTRYLLSLCPLCPLRDELLVLNQSNLSHEIYVVTV